MVHKLIEGPAGESVGDGTESVILVQCEEAPDAGKIAKDNATVMAWTRAGLQEEFLDEAGRRIVMINGQAFRDDQENLTPYANLTDRSTPQRSPNDYGA